MRGRFFVYFPGLKLSLSRTLRLKTRWSARQSRESMQKLLIQAKEEKYYELFLLEFATGLRLGELTALQWEDLNLTTGELRISKQAVVIGSELVITEPKTKAAVRTLLLPPKVLEVFREYRKRNVSRWLFPSPKKEDSPLLPSVVRQRLHRGRKRFQAIYTEKEELCHEK